MAKYLDLAGTTLLAGKLKDDATTKANNAASRAVSVHDNNVNAHSTLLSDYVKTTLQIAGKPLTGNITVAELTAALSVATQSLQGMLSSIDKKKIDDLWAIFDNGADESFADTLTEILEIFQNYPQGADITAQLAGKVDKVEGKGLSTNDYTTTEKTKLSGIETGAQKNVQADWDASSGDAFIKNKPTIPTVPNISVSNSGTGNVVTAITASGHALTVTKGIDAVTSTQLNNAIQAAIQNTWNGEY